MLHDLYYKVKKFRIHFDDSRKNKNTKTTQQVKRREEGVKNPFNKIWTRPTFPSAEFKLAKMLKRKC